MDPAEPFALESVMRPRPARRHTAVSLAAILAVAGNLAACTGASEVFSPPPQPTKVFANIPYAAWENDDPGYRLFPGDEMDVQVPSAPELNKTVTVQPDGRISLPLLDPLMVSDRSIVDAETIISTAYASQLIRPDVTITVRAQPLRVFVGGEVSKPGVYDMPGDINTLQAVVMAGGFTTTAKRSQVVLIRRGHAGKAMMRTVDLLHGISDPGHYDLVPLRRFDVIYVPKSGVGEVGDFVQQYIRNALPVSIGFSYATGGLTGF
jgi:protein involved in polysaccharide export with SLBB domain